MISSLPDKVLRSLSDIARLADILFISLPIVFLQTSNYDIFFNFCVDSASLQCHSKSAMSPLVGFVALRPKSTAMVIAGRSVHLTTLFPGQA